MTTLEMVRRRAELDAKANGYFLNPDSEFLENILEGLRVNEERFGYPACPCRIAVGSFELDRDIICPCDYRDPDVQDYGACYCCLYVDSATYEKGEIHPIPERRLPEKALKVFSSIEEEEKKSQLMAGVVEDARIGRILFYCRQCGYVVFREEPPYICPICRAKREMFSEIGPLLETGGT
ncbi:MAG: ferredoxin:glutaredoxin reductase [Candidatus Bathyarchaeota archaeon]|nr:MAG: ferredoxin:glutaredoxin reductase [Candidatus Bathyarchaeota archaeon]